jgi:hypothetical protein
MCLCEFFNVWVCVCVCGFFNVWVCVCVDFLIRECVYVWIFYCVRVCMCGFCKVYVWVCGDFLVCGSWWGVVCFGVDFLCVVVFVWIFTV